MNAGIFIFLHRTFHPAVVWVRSRSIVFRVLFGIKLPLPREVHYDTTTLLFRNALMKEVNEASRVLEMGIGQAALLSLFLAKKKGIQPEGVDISASRVASSRTVASYNSISAAFWESNLFHAVKEKYAVVFFNPPYVTTEAGEQLGLTKKLNLESDAAWNGGADGATLIRKFMSDAPRHLEPGGKLMIGVQEIYIPEAAMHQLADLNQLEITGSYKKRLNPSRIYVLKKK